jgi:Mechanosensitive ion channel
MGVSRLSQRVAPTQPSEIDVVSGPWWLAIRAMHRHLPNLTIRSEVKSALDQAVDQLISIGIALLSIFVVMALAKLSVRAARRLFWKRIASTSLGPDAATLINNAISIVVYFAAVTLLLALWGASWATLLTAISISTLAVVLGLQDLLKSMLGGAFVILDQPYSVGDRIAINDVEGEVIEVGMRTTIVRNDEGRRVFMPNALVLMSPLTNLDSEVASSTVVLLHGVNGTTEAITAEIEALLIAEPALAATVTVSDQLPRTLRPIVSRILGIAGKEQPVKPGTAGPLLVRIFLANDNDNDSRKSEGETIKRLKLQYPAAKVTVRHGSHRR